MHIPVRKTLWKLVLQPLEIAQGAREFVIAGPQVSGPLRHCRAETNAPIRVQQEWSDVMAQQVEADDGAEPNSGLESRVSDYPCETILRVRRARDHLNDQTPCGRGCASNMVA